MRAEFEDKAGDTRFTKDKDAEGGATHADTFIRELSYFGHSGQSAGILWLDDVLSAQLPEKLVTAVGRTITARYERNLRTVCTTNMTPSQIAQKFGPAIASRLCGGILLHAAGQDSRLGQCAGPKAAENPST